MQYVNRSAVILRYREPMVRWLMGNDRIEGVIDFPEIARAEHSIYLVPSEMHCVGRPPPMSSYYLPIFEHELFGWRANRSTWPGRLTWAKFQEWFEVVSVAIVTDADAVKLRAEPIEPPVPPGRAAAPARPSRARSAGAGVGARRGARRR